MKNLNWLIKALFYKHQEQRATIANTHDKNAIFYDVGYLYQVHANLCTDASATMLLHFSKRPIASMEENPRGMLVGAPHPKEFFDERPIDIQSIPQMLKKYGPFSLGLPLRYGVTHSVVVIGFAHGNIIYHDPLTSYNKLLSLNELTRINDHQPAIQGFVCKKQLRPMQPNKTNQLNDQPQNIALQQYGRFFSLTKMNNPCEAIKNFLRDYATYSLFTNRQHRALVEQFLNDTNNIEDIDELMLALNERLLENAQATRGELLKRLQAIKKVLNTDFHRPFKPSNLPLTKFEHLQSA